MLPQPEHVALSPLHSPPSRIETKCIVLSQEGMGLSQASYFHTLKAPESCFPLRSMTKKTKGKKKRTIKWRATGTALVIGKSSPNPSPVSHVECFFVRQFKGFPKLAGIFGILSSDYLSCRCEVHSAA